MRGGVGSLREELETVVSRWGEGKGREGDGEGGIRLKDRHGCAVVEEVNGEGGVKGME